MRERTLCGWARPGRRARLFDPGTPRPTPTGLGRDTPQGTAIGSAATPSRRDLPERGAVGEGQKAAEVVVETECLPDEADQVHVASYIQYKVMTGPTHAVARWRADPGGVGIGRLPELVARGSDLDSG